MKGEFVVCPVPDVFRPRRPVFLVWESSKVRMGVSRDRVNRYRAPFMGELLGVATSLAQAREIGRCQ